MEISGYATSARRLLAPRLPLSCCLPNKNPSSSLSSSTSLFFNNDGIVAKKRLLGLVSVRGSPNGGGGSPASSRRWRRRMGTCRCLFGLGVPELVVIAGVAALVFGPKQLPEIGRSIGKTIKSFQQAAKEFESELKREPEDGSQTTSAEGLNAIGSEDKKKELDTSDPKENV